MGALKIDRVTGQLRENDASGVLSGVTINADENTYKPYFEIVTGSASPTLTASKCYGGIYYVNAADTLTLPAVAEGMSITVLTDGAVAVSVDPNGTEVIRLDGVAGGAGKKITNLSTAGDVAVLSYHSAGVWYASTNSWTMEA